MCAICDFKIDFSVSHPLSLAVAVATREAIDRGSLPPVDMTGPLATARLKVSSIEALAVFQRRIEETHTVDELMRLPDFYVLLIEADTWGFFHPTPNGFDPDITPELPDVTSADPQARSLVLVTSETALRALIDLTLAATAARETGVVALDGPSEYLPVIESLLCVLTSVVTGQTAGQPAAQSQS